MTVSNKIQTLQKKLDKVTKEHEQAAKKLEQQQNLVKKKEQEVATANAELVNELLVEYQINLKELPSLLSKMKEVPKDPLKMPDRPVVNENHLP